jgi:integrase
MKFISYSSFTNILKKLLSATGYNPGLFSGHSFRRGGATFLYKLGASIMQIQVSGDWVSQYFARYLHVSEEERLHVQNLISAAISSGVA